jgi:hypothetical protein
MPRDAIAEWVRALTGREPAYAAFAQTYGLRVPVPLPPSAGGIRVQPLDLKKMRRPPGASESARSDLAQAIRVLQRHNRLLRVKFGIGWVDATNFVLGEAQRRGVATSSVARALSQQLRAERAT